MPIMWLLGGLAGALLLVMACLRFVLLLMEMGPPRIRPGWVCGVVGRMGQGKSLYAMYRVRKSLQAGSPVFVNFTIDASAHPDAVVYQFDSWQTFLRQAVKRVHEAKKAGREPVPALVVLDEAHLYAPATGMVLDTLARYVMSHARKLYCELLWITQHEARVASGVRDATAEMIEVKRKSRTWFRATTWEPETFRKKDGKYLWAERYRLSPKVTSLYGSWELLRPDDTADKDGFVRALLDELDAEGFEVPDDVSTAIREWPVRTSETAA